MKKIALMTLAAALLAVSNVSVCAQDKEKVTDPYPSFAGFVTNKFWDNWEISADFGTGFASFSSGNYGGYGDRFGLSGELTVTKWVHPVVGIRGQLMGGNYNTVNPAGSKVAWKFLFAHVDIVSNFSNWIGGYKENRVYYAIPFAGMGLFSSGRHTINYAFTAGLLNRFRVCPNVDINLELKGILGMSSLNPVSYSRRGRFLGTGNVSVGVTYRFGKRDYTRPEPASGYTPEEIERLKDAVKAAEESARAAKATEDSLKAQLAESRRETEAARRDAAKKENEVKPHPEPVAEPEMAIFFNSGSTLTESEKLRLSVFAERINSSPADRTYTVCGYADFRTGSHGYNMQLAEKRARVVYDYLLSLGVPASRLTYKGMGAGDQPFTAKGNQAVVIR